MYHNSFLEYSELKGSYNDNSSIGPQQQYNLSAHTYQNHQSGPNIDSMIGSNDSINNDELL